MAAKPLSKRTQAEIDSVINSQETNVADPEDTQSEEAVDEGFTKDTITIKGTLSSGAGHYEVSLKLALRDGDITNPEFSASLPALLSNLGIEPIIPQAPAATGGSTSGVGSSTPGGGQPATGGKGCPVHGTQYERPGFRNQGFECKAHAPTQQQWSRDKAWVSQDGSETRYYCKSKW